MWCNNCRTSRNSISIIPSNLIYLLLLNSDMRLLNTLENIAYVPEPRRHHDLRNRLNEDSPGKRLSKRKIVHVSWEISTRGVRLAEKSRLSVSPSLSVHDARVESNAYDFSSFPSHFRVAYPIGSRTFIRGSRSTGKNGAIKPVPSSLLRATFDALVSQIKPTSVSVTLCCLADLNQIRYRST